MSFAEEGGLPLPRRRRAVLTLALGVTMAVLDNGIANIALPTIAHRLGVSPATSIWVVNAYQIAIVISLLPLASLGEIVGHRRVYRAGLVVFTLASLLCALSGSLAELTAARTLQGFGAAGVMCVSGAMMRFIYPKRLLGRGIALNGMVVAAFSALGPTIAAGILSVAPWPWLFAVNLPIGALAIFFSVGSLPDTPRVARRFDIVSALLSAVVLGVPGLALHATSRHADAAPLLAAGAATMVCAGFLVRRQIGRQAPLLPIDLLQIPVFTLSIISSILAFGAQMLTLVSLPFYLHDTLGRSVVHTGLLLTAWPMALIVVAPLAGRLSDRVPAGLLGGLGLLVVAGGLTLLAALPGQHGDLGLAVRLAICGAGFALFQTPNNRIILQAAPPARAGGASGMLSVARLLGQTAGAALVALIYSLKLGQPMVAAVALAAGFAFAGAAISSLRLTFAGGVGQSA